MTKVITKMCMLFVIMMTGYLGNKLGVLDDTGNKKYSSLVVNITAPALILASASDSSLTGSKSDALFVLLTACGMYAFLILASMLNRFLFRLKKGTDGVYRFMTVFGNNAFMGIPVVEAVFGNVFYAALFNLPNNILIYSYGGYLLSKDAGSGTGKNRPSFGWKNVCNPGVIAAVTALVMFLAGFQFPVPVTDTLNTVGAITTPLSMLVIGSSLASLSLRETFANVRVYAFCAYKLMILPVVIWLIGRMFIDSFLVLGVLVIISAMPCAAVTVMLCNEYGSDAQLAARYVFVSTVLSVITIPVLAFIMSSV